MWLYVVKLKNFFCNSVSIDQTAENIFSSIISYSKILALDPSEKNVLRENLLNSMPALAFNPSILNQTPADQIFLIKEIYSV